LIEQNPDPKIKNTVNLALQPLAGVALNLKVQPRLFSNELRMTRDFVLEYDSKTSSGKPWLKIWPCFDKKEKDYSLTFLENLYVNKQIPEGILSACEDAKKAWEIATGKRFEVTKKKNGGFTDKEFYTKCKHSKLNEYLEKLNLFWDDDYSNSISQAMHSDAKMCTSGWFKRKKEIEALVEKAEKILIITPDTGYMCNWLKKIKIDSGFFLGGANPANGVQLINSVGISLPDPDNKFNKYVYDTSDDDCPFEYSVGNTFSDKFIRNPLHCVGDNCRKYDFSKINFGHASWSAGEFYLKCLKIPYLKKAYEYGMEKLGCKKSLVERYNYKGEDWYAQSVDSAEKIVTFKNTLKNTKIDKENAEQDLEDIKKKIINQEVINKSANEAIKKINRKIREANTESQKEINKMLLRTYEKKYSDGQETQKTNTEQKEDYKKNYNIKEKARDMAEKELNKEEHTLKQAKNKLAEKELNKEEQTLKQAKNEQKKNDEIQAKVLKSYLPLLPKSSITAIQLEKFVLKWWDEEEEWEDIMDVKPNRKYDKSLNSPKLQFSVQVVAEYPVKLFDFKKLKIFGNFEKKCDSINYKQYLNNDECAHRVECMMRMCGDGICDESCGEDTNKCWGDCASTSPSTMPSTSV